MATGTIILPIIGGIFPDGSTNNASARLQRVKSSATAPAAHWSELLFDPTTPQYIYFPFRMPSDYASAPVLKIQWKANATTGAAVYGARIAAVTPGDAGAVNAKAMPTSADSATTNTPASARVAVETSISITNNDTLAAGDYAMLQLFRDAANASDTLAVDAEVFALALEYTTV